MVFQCINIRQVPVEVLKTEAGGLGFQHLPRDLENVNAWKTVFDPLINTVNSVCPLFRWQYPLLQGKHRNLQNSLPSKALQCLQIDFLQD